MDECITLSVDRGEYRMYCKDMQEILSKKNDRGLGIDYSCVKYLLVNNEKELKKLIDDYLSGDISYEEIDVMSCSLESIKK
jgi:hypothetical protein